MKRKTRLRNKLKNRVKAINVLFLLIAFIIVVFFTPAIISTARYVYNAIHDNYVSSKDFYFSSDKLGTDHPEFQITNNWSGAQTYTIPINMTSKRNDMFTTESDIEYTISCECSDNIEYTLSKSRGTILGTIHEDENNNGTLSINEDWFDIDIDPKNGRILNNTEIAWIEVTVTSTSPYSQELTGKLILEVGSSNLYYEITDSADSPYLMVNIINSSPQAENVTLTYDPEDVLIDMTNHFYLNSTATTNETLNGYQYLNSVTSSVNSLSTTSVKFYKIDPTQDYTYSSSDNITPIISLSY